MDAALLDMRESAQDEASEGLLAQNPPRQVPWAYAGCLCLQEPTGGGRELGWHEHRGPAAILPPALGTWVPVPPWSACISVGLCSETLMVHRAGHGLRKSQTQNGNIRTQEQYSRGQEDKAETSTGTGAKALWLPSDRSKTGSVAGCTASLPEAAANTHRRACGPAGSEEGQITLRRSALRCPRAFSEPGTIHKCDAV